MSSAPDSVGLVVLRKDLPSVELGGDADPIALCRVQIQKLEKRRRASSDGRTVDRRHCVRTVTTVGRFEQIRLVRASGSRACVALARGFERGPVKHKDPSLKVSGCRQQATSVQSVDGESVTSNHCPNFPSWSEVTACRTGTLVACPLHDY